MKHPRGFDCWVGGVGIIVGPCPQTRGEEAQGDHHATPPLPTQDVSIPAETFTLADTLTAKILYYYR